MVELTKNGYATNEEILSSTNDARITQCVRMTRSAQITRYAPITQGTRILGLNNSFISLLGTGQWQVIGYSLLPNC